MVCVCGLDQVFQFINTSAAEMVGHACPEAGCNRFFEKPSLLKIHLEEHAVKLRRALGDTTAALPHKCQHANCTASFSFGWELRRHSKIHPTE